MDCENFGKRHGVHKSGRVTHQIFNCNDPNVGFCTLKETGLTTGGKPFAICSLQCPFYKERTRVTIEAGPITIPPRQSDRAVVTLAIGMQFHELLAISKPTIEAYATKCGADLVVISLESSDYPEGGKFRIAQLFDAGYSEILFIDADAVVMPDAENLFDIVPAGVDVALHDDQPMLRGRGWLDAEYRNLIDSQGWQMASIAECLNTGVMLIRASGRAALELPALPVPRTHTTEQSFINLNIARHGLKLFKLDRVWNEQWWFNASLPERPGTRIYHWASAPHATRVQEMTARRDGKIAPDSDWPLGDQVATALSAVGITKERVSKWLGKPCNCPARQAKLNRLGDWAAKVAKGIFGQPEAKTAIDKLLA